MLQITKGTIINGQSKEIGYTRHITKTNKTKVWYLIL